MPNIRLCDLRVLLVAPLPPPHGGIGLLTKALLDAGLGDGLHLAHLNTSKNTIREDFGSITWLDVRLAVRNFVRFAQLLVKEHADILYLISTADTAIYRDCAFLLAARFNGCRVILHLHGTRGGLALSSRRFHRAFIRRTVSMASYIVVPTDTDLEGLKMTYAVNVPSEVIRNTVSVPTDYPQSPRKSERQSGSLSLVAIGRLSEAKGAWDLFRALALVLRVDPSIKLTWVGLGASASDDQYARRFCTSLGIADNVRLVGQVIDAEKYIELEQADVFVLPTHSEGFPLALLEAMAMGLPVVTTPVGGIPEVIKDGVNGFLVQPRDVRALADRIVALLRDPVKRHNMGQANAKLYRENFAAQKAVTRLHELFSHVGRRGGL